MGLYLGGLKSGTNFAVEPAWVYIRVGLYSGFFGMRFYLVCDSSSLKPVPK